MVHILIPGASLRSFGHCPIQNPKGIDHSLSPRLVIMITNVSDARVF